MYSQRDLYSVLGVNPDASPEDIQTAYNFKTQNAQASLDEAYRMLSNPETRKAYDAGRASTSQLGLPSFRPPPAEVWSSPVGLFDHFFGPSPTQSRLFEGPSPFHLFSRMASPFSDPFFSSPSHGGWIDPKNRLGFEEGEQPPWTEKEPSTPSLWNRIFGSSGSDQPVHSTEVAAPSSATPEEARTSFFSRSYSSCNQDGQIVVNAEETSPDVRIVSICQCIRECLKHVLMDLVWCNRVPRLYTAVDPMGRL